MLLFFRTVDFVFIRSWKVKNMKNEENIETNILLNGNSITLYREDAVEGMPIRLKPGSVDVTVTSPPYNIGVSYKSYRDTMPREDYLEWTGKWIEAARGVLSSEGSLFLNIAGTPRDPLVPFQVLDVALRYFTLQNVIHWIKSIHIPKKSAGKSGTLTGDLTAGHYKPVNSKRFLNDCHEYIFHLTRSGEAPLDRLAVGVPYQDGSNISRWKTAGSGLHCRGNTWFIPYKTIKSRDRDRPHPASYPPELAAMCIMLHGVERCRSVMDPFTGIGGTALACADLRIDFTGFEIDESYIEETVRRLREGREQERLPGF